MKRIATAWLVMRMVGWLLVLPVLKRLMPLPSLVALMWIDYPPRRPATVADIERLSRITRWVAYRVWPRRAGTCLEQSLVLYRLLSGGGAAPELVIGARHDHSSVGAHAWIRVAGQPLGESVEDVAPFSPLVSFGPGGRPSKDGTLAPSPL